MGQTSAGVAFLILLRDSLSKFELATPQTKYVISNKTSAGVTFRILLRDSLSKFDFATPRTKYGSFYCVSIVYVNIYIYIYVYRYIDT